MEMLRSADWIAPKGQTAIHRRQSWVRDRPWKQRSSQKNGKLRLVKPAPHLRQFRHRLIETHRVRPGRVISHRQTISRKRGGGLQIQNEIEGDRFFVEPLGQVPSLPVDGHHRGKTAESAGDRCGARLKNAKPPSREYEASDDASFITSSVQVKPWSLRRSPQAMARSASVSIIRVRPLEITVNCGAASTPSVASFRVSILFTGTASSTQESSASRSLPAFHLMAHVGGDNAVERLEGSVVSGEVVQIVRAIELSRMEVDAYAAGPHHAGKPPPPPSFRRSPSWQAVSLSCFPIRFSGSCDDPS